MKFFKVVWDKIKQPKGWKLAVSLLLSIAIIIGTVLLVVLCPKQTVFHFIIYPIAVLALAEFIYLIVYLIPIIKKNFKFLMSKNKYTNKFITSYGFRAFVFAIFSFVINVGYAVFMGIISIIAKSAWFGIFAVYYLILSLMRGSVLWSKKKRTQKEEKTYLAVAIALLVLTITTASIVGVTYKFAVVSRFEGLLIYCSAAYTFYKLSLSIYNIIKAKKQESLLVEAVKDISFVDAIVSIFVLQVSMLQAFSANSASNLMFLNGFTGALVCVGIIAVAVLMIVKYFKIKKMYNEEKTNEEQKNSFWLRSFLCGAS